MNLMGIPENLLNVRRRVVTIPHGETFPLGERIRGLPLASAFARRRAHSQ
jgi:hypothetical protein